MNSSEIPSRVSRVLLFCKVLLKPFFIVLAIKGTTSFKGLIFLTVKTLFSFLTNFLLCFLKIYVGTSKNFVIRNLLLIYDPQWVLKYIEKEREREGEKSI